MILALAFATWLAGIAFGLGFLDAVGADEEFIGVAIGWPLFALLLPFFALAWLGNKAGKWYRTTRLYAEGRFR